MQVTKDNFPATLPYFLELLNTCEFYAFDEEMTGISSTELPEVITNSPEESYRAKRLVAGRYNIIQVGICLFHKDTTSASSPPRYIARPFNFILFPNHLDDYTTEERSKDVVLSPSSLAFLRRHDMDFQSWVYNGISYCDAAREEILRKKHSEKYNVVAPAPDENTPDTVLMTEEEKKWFDASVEVAQSFSIRIDAAFQRAKSKHTQRTGFVEVAAVIDLVEGGGKEVFIPPQRSKTAREHLSKFITKNFQNLSLTFRRQGVTHNGVIKAVFPEECARLRIQEQSLRDRELVDMLGFRLVFQALCRSQKPCVGHNCCADILFLLASLDGSLPETLSEFKKRMRELFPCVFDTRYIACLQSFFHPSRFSSRYLQGFFDEYGFLSSNVQVTLPLGFQSYDPLSFTGRSKSALVHEAGFDALLTGTLLLNLLSEMGGYNVSTAPDTVVNKVALFRSLYALDLGKAEDEYLPQQGVIELRHEKHVKTHHIDSCFTALSVQDVALYSVDEKCTLAVLPNSHGDKDLPLQDDKMNVGLLSTRITSRFPQYFEAKVYHPPHLSPMSAQVGAFHITPKNLMRFMLKSARK